MTTLWTAKRSYFQALSILYALTACNLCNSNCCFVAKGSFFGNVLMGSVFVCNTDFSNKSLFPGCKRFNN